MNIKDSLLPEFDHEMATTRRVLARVPDAALGWKPHDKSMTLGQLASHVANLPNWCVATLDRTSLDLDDASDFQPLAAATVTEILDRFDAKLTAARTLLAGQTDAELLTPWTLKKAGHEIFTMPRISTLRTFVLNHMIHHRGQLTVYLRLQNVAIPPVYGPTADEQ